MSEHYLLSLWKRAYTFYTTHHGQVYGNAVVFSLIFTLGPLFILCMSIISIVQFASFETIEAVFSSLLGNELFSSLLTSTNSTQTLTFVALAVSLVTLFFSIRGLLSNLQTSVQAYWGDRKTTTISPLQQVGHETKLLVVFLLLIIALFFSLQIQRSLLLFFSSTFQALSIVTALVIEPLISLLILSGIQAVLYVLLVPSRISLGAAALGGIHSAFLILMLKIVLGIYTSFVSIGSFVGAASNIMVALFSFSLFLKAFFFGIAIIYAHQKSPLRSVD